MSLHRLTVELLGAVSSPGDTIRELLASRAMTQVDLADRTCLDKKTINLIVSGNAPVTQDTAVAFEQVLGLPVSYWLTLEANHQASQAIHKQTRNLEECDSWVKSFPYSEMARFGWISPAASIADKARQLLNFFQVASPESWNRVYIEKNFCTSYRKSPSISAGLSAASVWLRQGEVEASKLSVSQQFDATEFKRSLGEIRRLTLLEDFVKITSQLQHLCLRAGVIYVPTRELPALGINGAMRWIGDRPVIQQTLRGKSHDVFWFTFFHEAWHVLQKQKRKVFLEGDEVDESDHIREAEADAMAAEMLIPKEAYFGFVANYPKKSVAVVRQFADSIGVHPGIVVGRLQREKRIPWNNGALNALKAHLHWPAS